MTTELQKKTGQAIVNVFETGHALGDYGNVTLMHGDSGHLTYGRSQTTLASGNLFTLITRYVSAPDAHFANQLKPYLPGLKQIDLSLDQDSAFRDLLKQAGSDPVMHAVQDKFFDDVYWNPAADRATQLKITSALGCCVVYDSTVHGSWRLIRDRTIADCGTPEGKENAWIQRYIAIRRNWLANNPNTLLQRTVYRMNELERLATADNWALALPIVVRGVTIDESVLAGAPIRVSGADHGGADADAPKSDDAGRRCAQHAAGAEESGRDGRSRRGVRARHGRRRAQLPAEARTHRGRYRRLRDTRGARDIEQNHQR